MQTNIGADMRVSFGRMEIRMELANLPSEVIQEVLYLIEEQAGIEWTTAQSKKLDKWLDEREES